MKYEKNSPWLVWIATALLFGVGTLWAQRPAPAAQPAAQEQEEYTEEEYDAYEKATQEKDGDKKQALLTAFMDKYPKSKLQQYIVTAYQTYMFELQKAGNWQKLEPAAETWFKYQPNDLQTVGFATDAAHRLGHDQKFLDYGMRIFAQKPSGTLASLFAQSYKKLGNEPKYLEWTEKLFSYPEFNGNFEMRMMFVKKYAEEKDFKKAAEYSQAALKSVAEAKKPDSTSEAEWAKAMIAVRQQCNFIIGMNYYNTNKYAEAVDVLEQSVKIEAFDVAYYYMGLSLWKVDKVEEAILAFAKAVVLKGKIQGEARDHLEKLYKALHNNTTIGIDKVYNRAKTELAGERASN